MKVDPDVWLLATAGAGLIATGGAFLRSAFLGPRVVDPQSAAANAPGAIAMETGAANANAEADLAALRQELAAANSTKEAQRVEMVEQRQRSERQVQGAQAEIQRLSEELEAEKSRMAASDATTKDLRTKLASTEEELRKSKSHASDPKALVALQSEVTDAQKKLKVVTEERDTARSKVEALERLVEGVRARSRELTEELKTLKGQ
jgi:chromosome segregation ATPase